MPDVKPDVFKELEEVLEGDTLYNRKKLLDEWKERWLVEGVMSCSMPREDLMLADRNTRIAKLAHDMLETLLSSMRAIPGLIKHEGMPTKEGMDFTIRLTALLSAPRPPPNMIVQ